MARRIAPDGGYVSSRKRDYRRRVWATLREYLKSIGVPIAHAQAMLMPSLEGDEIEVALNAGFREWNLHVVDMNAAITISLRRRYPKITIYGVTAAKAMQRASKDGLRIHCANFDFTNQVSKKFVRELASIAMIGNVGGTVSVNSKGDWTWKPSSRRCAVFSDRAIIAVNMLRGRESSRITELRSGHLSGDWLEGQIKRLALLSGQSSSFVLANTDIAEYAKLDVLDRVRLTYVRKELGLARWSDLQAPTVSLERAETYTSSNNQSFLWSVWAIDSFSYCADLRARADKKRISLGLAPLGPWGAIRKEIGAAV